MNSVTATAKRYQGRACLGRCFRTPRRIAIAPEVEMALKNGPAWKIGTKR
jgi:hypothetical protein